MNTTLIVVRPFGTHAKGDVITNAATIAQILAGEQKRSVVRVALPAATPAPAAAAAPASKGA